ncbi:MAG TPA: hypothetical protein VMU01_11610 [Rhizomicrobium sp.]|nr:hypothetical protein [Rhizomicrobium sp.]
MSKPLKRALSASLQTAYKDEKAMVSVINFDSSLLLSYYQAKIAASLANSPPSTGSGSSSSSSSSGSGASSATASDVLPWNQTAPAQEVQDAQALETTNFIDLSKVPVFGGVTSDAKTEQDNQKLFALYNAVNTLMDLASMSARDGTSAGQMTGYNTRFQQGLSQIEAFVKSESFNNFSLQAASASSSVVGTAKIPSTTFGYTGASVQADDNVGDPIPGLSTDQSFTVSVTKSGVTNNIEIDLSDVDGPLTIDNIDKYVNQQLSDAGCTSRFKRVITEGSVDDPTNASWGIGITSGAGETISLSAPAATPALYLANTSGLTAPKGDSVADSQGRLLKLTTSGVQQGGFSTTMAPDTGTSTAAATAVDASGNVYMLGNATGDFGSQLNQGDQDVYLSKYDSAGNLQWTELLGSSGTASGMSLAVSPTGGVVVAGSTNADLTTSAVANGNNDSFITKYDAYGNQVWTTQLQTLNKNQANAVSVDAKGNVYFGGQTSGVISAGQTTAGGTDAYLAKLDSKGNVVYEQQFGTTGSDAVAATAISASGDLYVASVQNGQAVLSKYTGGDATQTPAWQMNLGDLQGGSISGLAVSGDKIYVSGTSMNGSLGANVTSPSSGGNDAFIAGVTDAGTSATSDFVSYVGTSGTEKAGAVAVGPDGTVYLTGSTTGTFAGESRIYQNTNNMFVAAMTGDGQVQWAHQYGGADGQASGQGIAIDPNGSSVLDALGLPRGTVSSSQSPGLLQATTLRPGDSFKVAIQGTAARTFTVTVESGETLQSLVNKINIEFGTTGKASVYYSGGEALKLTVSPGVTAKILPGTGGFDALASLGIQPCTLTAAASSSSSTSSSTSSSSSSSTSSSTSTQVFGLGLNSSLDISTAAGASNAKTQLSNVLNAIQLAYQKTNTPAGSTAAGTSGASLTSGSVDAYTLSKLSSYNLALSILGGSSSTTA